MVSVNNFSISFNKIKILKNINFNVGTGEIVTLLGESGCGKTTILRAIAGLQREHDGNICISDTCVSSKDVFEKDREVGYIFQDYALFPHLNVEDNIAFALDKLSKKERKKRVGELLEQFEINDHRKKQIHQLSGGQQQRVAIARAMANKPKILLLDEPFANLDSQLKYKTKMWLKNLIKKHGLSAILVTHDKKEALAISDKIGIIHDKKLAQFSSTRHIYENPSNFYIANFLSDINVLPYELKEELSLRTTNDEVAIIEINRCKLTRKENRNKVEIIDISYCGEYYEVVAKLHNYKTSSSIIIRENKSIEVRDDNYYLEIKSHQKA